MTASDPYVTLHSKRKSELHSNAPTGGCSWMSGGIGEFSIPLRRNFSGVGGAGGISNIPGFNVGLCLLRRFDAD